MFKKLFIIALVTCAISGVLFAQELSDRDIQQIEYDAGTAYLEGIELYQQENYLEAIDKFNESLGLYNKIDTETNPKTDRIQELYTNLSIVYHLSHHYDYAIKYYKLRQEYEPDNYKNAIQISSIYHELGDDEKELQVLLNFDKKYDNYKISKRIASIYENNNDFPNAIIYYINAFELNPKKVEYLEKIALLYNETNETAKAIKAYEDYIATEPADYILRKVYKNLGNFYMEIEQKEKAIIALKKSIQIKSDREILFNLGSLFYECNNYKESKYYFKEFQKIDQNNPEAHYYMGKIYREEELWDKAIAEFELILNNPEFGKFAKEEIEFIKKQQ